MFGIAVNSIHKLKVLTGYSRAYCQSALAAPLITTVYDTEREELKLARILEYAALTKRNKRDRAPIPVVHLQGLRKSQTPTWQGASCATMDYGIV
jgi:hypothetical protein